uniref:hypothetical protein n=1 Tax=Ningiella ruwaisensis TaxID=2364274 RepID=UPI00109FEF0A|nr:hypothetical protein [Ningiella ruwaisensis]
MPTTKYKVTKNLLICAIATSLFACTQPAENENDASKMDQMTDQASAQMQELTNDRMATQISVYRLEDSPAFANASLQLISPDNLESLSSGDVAFEFKVENYDIGAQTQGSNATLLANSDKGQHIHFILNNQPYSAHYETSFMREIPEGEHHLVAFLSRSYHESVKNDNSVFVARLAVGEDVGQQLDMDNPTLIYSRPKGTYTGAGTENILLDFFVLNTELSENGNKVKAVINGEEFFISEWAPHVIKGLPMGEATIELSLVDGNNQPIPGPFNQVTRTITLNE